MGWNISEPLQIHAVTFLLMWKGVHYTYGEKSKVEASVSVLLNMVD